MATVEKDLRNSVEFIQDRLYYVALGSTPPSQNPRRHFFSIDAELIYWNFFLDFGPLNFGQLYRFCERLNRKLSDPKLRDKVIYYYSSTHSHKRTNAAFLISAWAVLYQGKSPDEAFQPFKNYSPPFPPWHDATPTICTFQLTILDTLRGLYKARECKFFDLDNFPIEEYEHYEQVENGDLNWCVAGKFIAFAGPHATREMSAGGYHTLCPSDYVPYFKKRNVTLVVRLNKKYYPAESFTHHGIDHIELEFLDGSNPPDFILSKFIDKCELTPGAAAVHCKAGLGRTGSCIGAYMMKHFRFTAEEAIGWMRIVRPGMVIGPQQQWMRDMQMRMWQEGEVFYAKLTNAVPNLPLPALSGQGGSNRNTPRTILKAQQASHEMHTDLPAMEEKSSYQTARDDGYDVDGKAQGDLLRIRREQQHKNHFPIEPGVTSLSMKVPSTGGVGLRGSQSVVRTSSHMVSSTRPTTPGGPLNVKLFNNNGNASEPQATASGKILRTPTNAAIAAAGTMASPIQPAGYNSQHSATGLSGSGSIAITVTPSPRAAVIGINSQSTPTPPSSGKNVTSFSFFGTWARS